MNEMLYENWSERGAFPVIYFTSILSLMQRELEHWSKMTGEEFTFNFQVQKKD